MSYWEKMDEYEKRGIDYDLVAAVEYNSPDRKDWIKS